MTTLKDRLASLGHTLPELGAPAGAAVEVDALVELLP